MNSLYNRWAVNLSRVFMFFLNKMCLSEDRWWGWLVARGWLDVSRIYVALAIFQPYRDLEVGDTTSLWTRSGETGNRTPDLLLCKPIA